MKNKEFNQDVQDAIYELAVDIDKFCGGDGKLHIEERSDGTRAYSGPMTNQEYRDMMNDPNSVLVIWLETPGISQGFIFCL